MENGFTMADEGRDMDSGQSGQQGQGTEQNM